VSIRLVIGYSTIKWTEWDRRVLTRYPLQCPQLSWIQNCILGHPVIHPKLVTDKIQWRTEHLTSFWEETHMPLTHVCSTKKIAFNRIVQIFWDQVPEHWHPDTLKKKTWSSQGSFLRSVQFYNAWDTICHSSKQQSPTSRWPKPSCPENSQANFQPVGSENLSISTTIACKSPNNCTMRISYPLQLSSPIFFLL